MNGTDTQVNLSKDAMEAVYNLQERGYAEIYVNELFRIMASIIRNDLGKKKERMDTLSVLQQMQDMLRCFIPEDEKGKEVPNGSDR